MHVTKTIIVSMLVVTPAIWWAQGAMAQKKDEQGRHLQERHQQAKPHPGQRNSDQRRHDSEPHQQPQLRENDIRIGGYFQPHHRESAREYYSQPENHGFCPPGLAKKGNGCLPPGQARKWRRGEPLPKGVVYYEVPRSVALSLGAPPSGYRYVRVASDILLIAIGSQLVIDAMEDLVR